MALKLLSDVRNIGRIFSGVISENGHMLKSRSLRGSPPPARPPAIACDACGRLRCLRSVLSHCSREPPTIACDASCCGRLPLLRRLPAATPAAIHLRSPLLACDACY